jgi:hypothetical protein
MRKLEEKLLSRSNQQEILASLTPESQTSPVAFSETNTNTNLPFFQGHSESASDVTLNLSCNLGSFPGSSIITLTFTEPDPQSSHNPDLISSGLITLEAAEEYFSIYQNRMEPCIYQILAPTDCLANVRARSSLLTSAICTVGSFCADSAIHKRCYDAFIKEVSSRLFSRKHSFDDVRALCIGAFWLNKVSSTLVGLGTSPPLPNKIYYN